MSNPPPIFTTIKLRRGTAALWASSNPVLADGEPGYETDTRKMKIGNGTSSWNSLPYFVEQSDLSVFPRYVAVMTGSEARPSAPMVFWVGGETKPVHMADSDIWFAQVVTPVDTPPTTPTGLSSSNITDTTFTVSWVASTDDVGVTGYRVTINGMVYSTPSVTTQVVSGRTAETAYTVTVAARDAVGNWSSESAALIVTTDEVPSGPVYLSVFEPYFDDITGSPDTHSDLDAGGQTAGLFYSTTHDITVYGLKIYNASSLTSGQLSAPVTARLASKGYSSGSVSLAVTTDDVLATEVYSETRIAGTWTEILFDAPITIPKLTNEADVADVVILSVSYGAGWSGGYHHWTSTQMEPFILANSEDSTSSGPVPSPDGSFYSAENAFPRVANRIASGVGTLTGGSGWYGIDILCTTTPA